MIQPSGSADAIRTPGRTILPVTLRDTLTTVTLAWRSAASPDHRFRLVNGGVEPIHGFTLLQRLAPGSVPRHLVRTTPDAGDDDLSMSREGEARTITLQVPVIGPGQQVALEFATAASRKSMLPLLAGTGLALLHLIRRRAMWNRTPPDQSGAAER
jgi:hypothetical protein